MKWLRTLLTFVSLAAPSLAFAQGVVYQGGPWTSGHPAIYNGPPQSTAIVQDPGPAGGAGAGISELNIVARGTGTPPYAAQGTGPYGTIHCEYDAPITNRTGYHALCFSPNAQGGGLLSYNAYGGATGLPLQFIINGTPFSFPLNFGLTGYLYGNGLGAPLTASPFIPNAGGGLYGTALNAIPYGQGSAALPAFVAACASGVLTYNSSSVPVCATALPNGVTATTQSTSDNSTLVATDAYVRSFFPLSVTLGGTGDTSFTANAPLIGNGSSALAQGSTSGSSTAFTTRDSSVTNGHCVQWDGSGGLVDAGGTCTTGGGGTVSGGTAGQITYYAATGNTVVGGTIGGDLAGSTLPSFTIASGAVTAAKMATGAAVGNIGYTPLAPANNLSDVSNAATALTNLKGLPHAANNTALSALAHNAYGSTSVVVRDGFATAGDGPPVEYTGNSSACSLGSGAGDGGSQVPTSDSGCWIAAMPTPADIRIWGATNNGSDTTAWQNAWTWGGTIWIPGNFTLKITAAASCGTAGTAVWGGFGAVVENDSTTNNTITATATGCGSHYVRYTYGSGVTPTAGAIFNCSGCNAPIIEGNWMYGWFDAISFTGVGGQNARVFDNHMVSPAGTSSVCISVNQSSNSVDMKITHNFCEGTSISSQLGAGFQFFNIGDATVTNNQILFGGQCIYLSPNAAGKVVQYIDVSNNLMDQCTNAFFADATNATGTGSTQISQVQQFHLAHNWMATAQSIDINLQTDGSTGSLIGRGDIDGNIIANAASHGVLLNDSHVVDIGIHDNCIAQNTGFGIVGNSGIGKIYIHDNIIGECGQFTTSSNGSGGISLTNANHTIIHHNDLTSQSSNKLGNASYSSGTVVIEDNLGYNPVGGGNISTSSSPFTYTCGASPQDIIASATSSISGVTQGGAAMLTGSLGANVQGFFHCNPNEALVFTYTGTLSANQYTH